MHILCAPGRTSEPRVAIFFWRNLARRSELSQFEIVRINSSRLHQILRSAFTSSGNGGGWVSRANRSIDHRIDTAQWIRFIVCVITSFFRGIYFSSLFYRKTGIDGCARATVCAVTRCHPNIEHNFLFHFAPTDKHFLSLVRIHSCSHVWTVVADANCNLDSIVTAKKTYKFIDFNCIFHICGKRCEVFMGTKNGIENASLLHAAPREWANERKLFQNSATTKNNNVKSK